MKKQVDSLKETEEGAIMAGERRDTQVTGTSSEKESPSVMGVVTSDIVADSIVKSRDTAKRGPGEVNGTTHGSDVQHKLPGNTLNALLKVRKNVQVRLRRIWMVSYQSPMLVLISRILHPLYTPLSM